MSQGSKTFINLLIDNEEWLMERILQYAKDHEFTKYTSTLHEAWRLSVHGLTHSIVLAVKSTGMVPPELHPDETYQNDPVSAFGMTEAKKHRSRGVTLSMFLALLKYYRQAYTDLIKLWNGKQVTDGTNYTRFIDRCFDRIELGYLTEWINLPGESKLEELQSANREITNEKNKYLTVFESLFAPVILLNSENKIVNFNLSASQLFTDINIAGSPYYNISLSEQLQYLCHDRIIDFIDSPENDLSFETYLETKNGTRYYKVLLKKMLDISEKFTGTLILLQDLTEQNNTEKHLQVAKTRAEEADKLKTAFLANMSHEIRTPMNAIIGFTELLLNENHNQPDRTEYLKLIRRSSNDLLNIIEDIIDIAKIEAKQIKIKYKPCRPIEILSDLKIVFESTLRRYGINDEVSLLVKVAEKDKNIIFYTDGERLKQVLSNLLSNAAKFTNKGFIEYGFKRVEKTSLYFFVRDSGTGIPLDLKEKIFERFYQLEEHSAVNFGGAGLGLAICKNIVQLLGGKIWVESTPGKGSDFYFQLPFREVPENEMDIDSNREESDEVPDWCNKLFLIAEDDDINYLFLNEILTKAGATILRARNGLETINIAEAEEQIDLILMDIKMPEIDGYEAARYITSIRPEIPIIAQTAFAMEGDKAKCISAGCCAYISKPVDKQKLFELIQRYLKHKEQLKTRSVTH